MSFLWNARFHKIFGYIHVLFLFKKWNHFCSFIKGQDGVYFYSKSGIHRISSIFFTFNLIQGNNRCCVVEDGWLNVFMNVATFLIFFLVRADHSRPKIIFRIGIREKKKFYNVHCIIIIPDTHVEYIIQLPFRMGKCNQV